MPNRASTASPSDSGARDGDGAPPPPHPPAGGGSEIPAQPLFAVPRRHAKVVYLIRHAEGTHNVAGTQRVMGRLRPRRPPAAPCCARCLRTSCRASPAHTTQPRPRPPPLGRVLGDISYRDETYADAHLTPRGWRQAAGLRSHFRTSGLAPPGAVVVSPLTRTLETAAAVLGGEGAWEPARGAPLMVARGEVKGLRPAASAIPAPPTPFVADELCREHAGVHPCDRRRAVSHYRSQFPAVDFSNVTAEGDEVWRPDAREPFAAVRDRAAAFARSLAARPEGVLAVVSHAGFLGVLSALLAPGVVGEFRNAELRAVLLVDAGGGSPDPDWHGGGDGVPLDDGYVKGCSP